MTKQREEWGPTEDARLAQIEVRTAEIEVLVAKIVADNPGNLAWYETVNEEHKGLWQELNGIKREKLILEDKHTRIYRGEHQETLYQRAINVNKYIRCEHPMQAVMRAQGAADAIPSLEQIADNTRAYVEMHSRMKRLASTLDWELNREAY